MLVFNNICIIIIFCCLSLNLPGQEYSKENKTDMSGSKIIAVPFLLIVPDARAGAMGNAGVAIPSDVNPSCLNPAKLGMLSKSYGAAISYIPWLDNLTKDVSLSYFSSYCKIDDKNTIGASLRYFSLGDIQLTDVNKQHLGIVSPNETALDFTYAKTFGKDFSIGSSIRYISSNLFTGHHYTRDGINKPGTAFAVDVGGLFEFQSRLLGKDALSSVGINISNIGTKLSYSDADLKYFLPANIKLGGAAKMFIDNNQFFVIGLDICKPLTPALPTYDEDGNIIKGKDPNRSSLEGILGSFNDAPNGVSEEIDEIGVSTGIEYNYKELFSFRCGYSYNDLILSSGMYLTVGGGFKYKIFDIDLSYIIADSQKLPLSDTLRFSLSCYLNKKK